MIVLPPLIGNTAEWPAGIRVTVVSVIDTTMSKELPLSVRRAVTRTEGEGALIGLWLRERETSFDRSRYPMST